MAKLPEPTPQYQLKPKLEWVGCILGMDLYVDTSRERQPNEKRLLAEKILKKAFGMTK